ncbi:chitin-binding protein [Salinispora arenicola]|uniref:carbohydrate-binding protein n=1 Tax=Salinispora arenicola TaxID=168697 RepID=UPI00142FB224|nr:carbohydrate-binding protein [Salinispora arenicola]NIL40867.1 chitin-binding protein [Salinispora arenicola]
MRKRFALPLMTMGAVTATMAVAAPAQAHGYVSGPPSRQALCAQGSVPDCGPISFEPQSVEGPKGLTSCSGGISEFAVLDDESRAWPAATVGRSVTFDWIKTAPHKTSNWEYFIGDEQLATFDGGGVQPPSTLSHTVDLGDHVGRQKVLAVWNIADTPMAFYSCIDVNIDGGPSPTPTGTASPTPTASPTSTASPTPTASPTGTASPTPTGTPSPTSTGAPAPGSWQVGTTYQIGDEVTYDGVSYRARQAHTATPGWEPPRVPALWTAVTPPATGDPAPGDGWAVGIAYQIGDEVTYDGVSYRARQAHTATPGWEPPHVPSLWIRI